MSLSQFIGFDSDSRWWHEITIVVATIPAQTAEHRPCLIGKVDGVRSDVDLPAVRRRDPWLSVLNMPAEAEGILSVLTMSFWRIQSFQ